jgi:hypothetical protein
MNNATNPKLYQAVNILAVAAVIFMNYLSNALPINGRTAGEISDSLPSYFTPAGYTFAIWGLIYAALVGFAVYQALPAQQTRPFLVKYGWLVALSSVFNIAWLLTWHYALYILSLFLMGGLLLTLIAIYLRLDIGRPDPTLTTADKLLYHAPFSLYLGWITVATIANVASVLGGYYEWGGFGIAEPVWAVIMIVIAVIVAGVLLINRRNISYAGVLIWALFGIRAAQADTPLVANAAVVAAIAILVLALIGYWRTRELAPPVPVISPA